jgi:transcriptional regulator GlxA family with amidase domain
MRAPKRSLAHVGLLALPETTPATLYGLYEVFSAVGVSWAELTGRAGESQRMLTRIVSAEGVPFVTPLGPISPHGDLAERDMFDVLIVTDLSLTRGFNPRGQWTREAEWVRCQYEQGATVCSVCTGSIFLAESGLLDGCEATSHWSAADMLRELYPSVRVRAERILCPADTEQRLITAGGASSWEDLALHLIARYSGPQEAIRIAKIFVLGDRSEGQLPFAVMSRGRRHDDAVVATSQRWIAENYTMSNPVARMVERSGLPDRTFKRRFKAATGFTPVKYAQVVRVEEAKQILETTNEPTEAVAQMVGYEDPRFFRSLFKRQAGVSPARYRQLFRP